MIRGELLWSQTAVNEHPGFYFFPPWTAAALLLIIGGKNICRLNVYIILWFQPAYDTFQFRSWTSNVYLFKSLITARCEYNYKISYYKKHRKNWRRLNKQLRLQDITKITCTMIVSIWRKKNKRFWFSNAKNFVSKWPS